MKIQYICHASLLIDTGDLKIVTDPWLEGATYCGQWHLFPKPAALDGIDDADIILISHGHEDHFHEPSMRMLPKRAKVFYPHSWFGGTKEFIRSLGFEDVREALSYKTYKLSTKTGVTYIANTHDNIIVIESDGHVFVNVNDALHSYPQPVIDFYLAALKKRWERIDVLFCGFGGASYFPNAVHLEGKNDREIGIVREQLFAHNFCRIVADLQPRVAVPFAADFALLSPSQRWINDVRFPRSGMSDYYQRHFKSDGLQPKIYDMYSGDVLDLDELKPESPYRKEIRDGGLDHLIDEQYGEEVARLRQPSFISESDAAQLNEEIYKNVKDRMHLFRDETLRDLKFCLRVSDVLHENCYQIGFRDGEVQIVRSDEPGSDCSLTMDISGRILRHSFSGEWGGDAVSIGYGCEIYIHDERAAAAGLDGVCLRLLSRHPTVKSYIRKEPLRALKHMVGSPLKHTLALRKLGQHNMRNENYDRSIWLLQSPDEIRRICNLPVPDAKTASQS